jgi:hypothetical protein
MTIVGATATSVGALLASAEGDSRVDGLVDGVWLGVGVTMAEGTPARTPSPGVERRVVEAVGRTLPSQLEPIATVPARSTSATPATA